MVKQDTIVVIVNTILITIVTIYTILVLISSTINNSRIKSINLNYNIKSLSVKSLHQPSSSLSSSSPTTTTITTTPHSGIKKGIKKAVAVATAVTSPPLQSPAPGKQAPAKSAKGKQAAQRLRRTQAARTITFAIPTTPTHRNLSPIPSFGVALSLRLTLPRAQRGVRIIYRRSNLRSKRLNREDINNPTTTA